MPRIHTLWTIFIIGFLLALLPVLPIQTNKLFSQTLLRSTISRVNTKIRIKALPLPDSLNKLPISRSANMSHSSRTPVYFLSHGGPNIMEDTAHPAYAKLQEIGREITQKVRPKAVVVFSAHWQAGRDAVEVNTAEQTGLIYDYYGFPPHYYEVAYPHVGDPALAARVLALLRGAGIAATGTRRGLDHGVFAPFRVAFDPAANPLGAPIVQVSLFGSDDADAHHRLGRALAPLRDDGVLVLVSGMAVHNLRDLFRALDRPAPMPYAVSFDEALRAAVEQPPESRQRAMAALLARPDARQAHPSFEHLLPIHVGAGAAGEDLGERIWTLTEGSTSWAQYRFGEVGA